MFHHLPATTYSTLGFYIDLGQLILMVAVAYLLWWLVRTMHQLHAIGRFWLDRWNDTPGIGSLRAIEPREVIEEAAGDRLVPNASLNGPTPTPVTRERAEDFSRAL